MGDVVPARGLVGRVPGLASRALDPRTVHGLVDVCALIGALHFPPLPMCSLGGPGRGLWTTSWAVGFTHALGVTAHSLSSGRRQCRSDRS